MPIEIELPDGNVVEFPDGTDNATMEKALGAYATTATKPDFGNVQGGSQTVSDTSATDGMGQYEKYIVGGVAGLREFGQGIKQRSTEAAALLARATAGSPEARSLVDQKMSPVVAGQRQQTAELRRLHAPINGTGMGKLGNVVFQAGALFGPGAAFRNTGVGAALLPQSIRGNALLGAAVGGAQASESSAETAGNVALGGGFGAAGAVLPKIAGAAYSGLRSLVSGIGSGQRKAAELIAAESSGLRGLLTPQPSTVPGVQRTLAEEALDPGVARLERQMRGQTNIFQPIDTANNAARVNALENISGGPSSIRDAERARAQASNPLLRQAMQDKGVDVAGLSRHVQGIADANATRPSVASAITDVQRALASADDSVESLYGVRKYIGDLLSGKAGADKSYARAASRELKSIQGELDAAIGARSPAFGQYLDAYRTGSKPIDRFKVGQNLLAPSSGGAVLDPVTGMQQLTPASFSRKARDLDAVAATATGFRKARAEDILTPSDLATIRGVQDDLERQSFRATAGSGGNSMTQERTALQDRMTNRLASKIPVIGGFVEAIDQLGKQRVNERLAYLLANPEEARRVLQSLNSKDRDAVGKALAQISTRSGALAPALAE